MKKKALIIILLAFAVPCCWAQERLSSQLDEMQKSLDYGDRELFNNLVNVISFDSLNAADDLCKIRYYRMCGDFCYESNNYEKATVYYEKASQHVLHSGIIDSLYIHSQNNLAKSYIQLNDIDNAERALRHGIVYGSDFIEDYSLSADLFRTLLELDAFRKDSLLGDQIHQKVQTYAFNTYYRNHPQAHPEKPIEEFLELKKAYKISQYCQTRDYVIFLSRLGSALQDANILDETRLVYEKALKIAENNRQIDKLSTALIWIRLVRVYGNIGDTEALIELIPKATEYYKSIKDNRYTAVDIYSFAAFSLIEGNKFEESLFFLKEAEKLLDTCSEKSDSDLVIAKQNIYSYYVTAYMNLDDQDRLYKALDVLEGLFLPYSEEYYNCLSIKTSIDMQSGNHLNALKHLRQMEKNANKLFSNNSIEHEDIFCFLGITYMALNDFKKAEISFKRAISIYEKGARNRPENIQEYFNNLAVIYHNKGNYSKAIEYYKRTNDLYQVIHGTRSKEIESKINECKNHLR